MIRVLAVSDIVYDIIRVGNQTECFSGVKCTIVAFLDQFSTVFDTLGQSVLTFAFLHLLLQNSVPKIENKRKLLNICKHSRSCSCSILMIVVVFYRLYFVF